MLFTFHAIVPKFVWIHIWVSVCDFYLIWVITAMRQKTHAIVRTGTLWGDDEFFFNFSYIDQLVETILFGWQKRQKTDQNDWQREISYDGDWYDGILLLFWWENSISWIVEIDHFFLVVFVILWRFRRLNYCEMFIPYFLFCFGNEVSKCAGWNCDCTVMIEP